MATYTVKGQNQEVDAPHAWHVWEVELTSAATDEDPLIVLQTLPVGTTIIDARLTILQADTAATSSTAELGVGAEGVVASTNAKTVTLVGAGVAAEIGDACVNLRSAEQDVSLLFTRTGAATTLPIVLVSLLCGRVEY